MIPRPVSPTMTVAFCHRTAPGLISGSVLLFPTIPRGADRQFRFFDGSQYWNGVGHRRNINQYVKGGVFMSDETLNVCDAQEPATEQEATQPEPNAEAVGEEE